MPEGAAGIELAEHSVAGVVSGYSGDVTTRPAPGADKRGGQTYERLLDGREPVLELTGEYGRYATPPTIARRRGGTGCRRAPRRKNCPASSAWRARSWHPAVFWWWSRPIPTPPACSRPSGLIPRMRPLFPEVGLGLCRLAGFGSAFVLHPGGSGNVEADRLLRGRLLARRCAGA